METEDTFLKYLAITVLGVVFAICIKELAETSIQAHLVSRAMENGYEEQATETGSTIWVKVKEKE